VLAQRDLGAGGTGFALLISAYGAGIVGGSLLVARTSGGDGMRRAYLAGLGLMGLGLLGSSAAPGIAAAVGTFAVTGAGNSLAVVAMRVMLQQSVPARLHGRAFGLLDSISAWGLAAAFLGGGALASAAGARLTFALAGAGTLVLLTVAARSLGATRRAPRLDLAPAT
jgi:MFS family permease